MRFSLYQSMKELVEHSLCNVYTHKIRAHQCIRAQIEQLNLFDCSLVATSELKINTEEQVAE